MSKINKDWLVKWIEKELAARKSEQAKLIKAKPFNRTKGDEATGKLMMLVKLAQAANKYQKDS